MNTYVMKDVELYSSVVRVIIRYFRSKNLWSSFILVLAGVFSDAEQTTRLRLAFCPGSGSTMNYMFWVDHAQFI